MSADAGRIGLARALRVMRDTFMISQGRSDVQIAVIDALARTWREQGLRLDTAAFDTQAVGQRLRKLRMPRGHAPYREADVVAQFDLWWELLIRLTKYVDERQPSHLPTEADRARFSDTYVLPIDPAAAQRIVAGKDADVSAFMDSISWYAVNDPAAEMTSLQALERRVLPLFIAGDRQWVRAPHGRPGSILPGRNDSLLLTILPTCARDRDEGRTLSDMDALYARMHDILRTQEATEFATLPEYPQLLADDRNPGEGR